MNQTESQLLARLAKMEGWCAPEKALTLYQHVIDHKPTISVEIGVFGGQSLMAIATGLRAVGAGLVLGVDSWKKEDCLADFDGETDKAHIEWWAKLDLEAIRQGCVRAIMDAKLEPWVGILQTTSQAAAERFELPIELLHIDGCHSEWASTTDVVMWLPKLRPGGYAFLDDTNWPSTQTAVRFTEKLCEKVKTVKTEKSTFSVYRKI